MGGGVAREERRGCPFRSRRAHHGHGQHRRGERGDDPDWLRFRLLGATNPTYFGLYARRRIEQYGATPDHFAKVKVKNARHGLHNPYARFRKEVSDLYGDAAVQPARLAYWRAVRNRLVHLEAIAAEFLENTPAKP